MLQDYRLAIVLLLLLATIVVASYVVGRRPASGDRKWVVAVVIFLLWLLAGMQLLRASRPWPESLAMGAAGEVK